MFGADPPLQSEATVHSTEAGKVPVPSAMTGDKFVNPTRPPAGVSGALATLVIVEPAMASLNRNSSPPPAPVSTNLVPLFSTTVKLTDVPDCVSVTVPNTVPGAGHPVLIWHDVKSNESAWLTLGNAALAASNAAPANATRPKLCMMISLFGVRKTAGEILHKKPCQSSSNFLD